MCCSEPAYKLGIRHNITEPSKCLLVFAGGAGDSRVVLHTYQGQLKLSVQVLLSNSFPLTSLLLHCLQVGSAQFNTGVYKVLFNDSAWHTVELSRRAEKVGGSCELWAHALNLELKLSTLSSSCQL